MEGKRVHHHIVYEHLDEKEYAREENTREQGREEDSKHHHHFSERLGKKECVRERHTKAREGGRKRTRSNRRYILVLKHLKEKECERDRHTRGRETNRAHSTRDSVRESDTQEGEGGGGKPAPSSGAIAFCQVCICM